MKFKLKKQTNAGMIADAFVRFVKNILKAAKLKYHQEKKKHFSTFRKKIYSKYISINDRKQ